MGYIKLSIKGSEPKYKTLEVYNMTQLNQGPNGKWIQVPDDIFEMLIERAKNSKGGMYHKSKDADLDSWIVAIQRLLDYIKQMNDSMREKL